MTDNPAMRIANVLTILSSIALSFSVVAATLEGKVIAIQDGDTLTLLVDRRQVKVRLAEIDAPESKQSFGTVSRQSLAELCFQKSATAEIVDRDRYGRAVGRVRCDGVDANAAQVERGMSWVYERYAKPSSPLWLLQDKAKRAKIGLWTEVSPVEPWRWRMK